MGVADSGKLAHALAHTQALREHAGRVAQIKFDAKNRNEVLDVIQQAIESSQ